ncbi:MAG TPA: hypothetical protein VGZ04_00545 [Acidimicrobiales bacterium]|nr:hypothetical protein [Acidimicrobiales bacterium]
MNDNRLEALRPPTRLERMRRTALLTVGMLAVGVTLAACGGPATPGVATGSTTTTTSTLSSSSGAPQGTGILAYSACMRAHGVTNFPDPGANGGIDNKQAVVNAMKSVSVAIGNAAQKDCAHVLPAGEGLGGQDVKPITTQDQQYYLRAVACMRTHGFPNFPDPIFSGGTIRIPPTPSINTNSSQYVQARDLCTKLIPAGLPDSGNGRSSGG